MSGYQGFELLPTFDTFIPRSVTPSEVDCIQSPEVYRIVDLDSTVSPDNTVSPSPSSDSQEGQSSVTCAIDAESKKHKLQTVKRRMQNRNAQRRFRERKEEHHQTLQQRATELEAKCQELSEGLNQKSEEISKILKEKEALTGEVQDLRKRWRLMVMLLRLPNRLQSLSGLLGSDLSSSCSSSSEIKAEPLDVPLEDLFGCLQELLLPNEASDGSPLCPS
ncbi:bZIP transcription factor, bZIP-1 [Penicillium griseofulvum]|uniref:BZIP transcription factor, bZIP-1 n=1 Tax=Penicillium patulum TaxID=5078 RepID=A0A135LBV7_PENPA|nr:bZIP transcription factor, bZIP-1 [Penicillium griseofulvum]KXG46461.1 bZIP transcription factor, bZIP-1 [Penicillium griseofulvum]